MSEGRLLIGLTFQQSVIRGDRERTWMDDVRAPARLWHFVTFFSCLNFWRDGGLARWRQAGRWGVLEPAPSSAVLDHGIFKNRRASVPHSDQVISRPDAPFESRSTASLGLSARVSTYVCHTPIIKKIIKKQKHHHLVCDHVRKRVSPLLNLASHFRVGRIVISRLCQQRKL